MPQGFVFHGEFCETLIQGQSNKPKLGRSTHPTSVGSKSANRCCSKSLKWLICVSLIERTAPSLVLKCITGS